MIQPMSQLGRTRSESTGSPGQKLSREVSLKMSFYCDRRPFVKGIFISKLTYSYKNTALHYLHLAAFIYNASDSQTYFIS